MGLIKKYWKGFAIGAVLFFVLFFATTTFQIQSGNKGFENIISFPSMQIVKFLVERNMLGADYSYGYQYLLYVMIGQAIIYGCIVAYIYHNKLGKK